MLILCPECKKKLSEIAESCPKCGFVLDETIRKDLKAKTIRNNRGGLTVLAILMLLFSGPCVVKTAGGPKLEGYYSVDPSSADQQRAHEKFTRGQPLSNSDVDDLAGRRRDYVSGGELESGRRTVLLVTCLVLVFPAVGILLYLLMTRQENPSEDHKLAIDITSDAPETQCNIGTPYEINEPDDTKSHHETGATREGLESNDAEAYHKMGSSYEDLKQYNLAITAYKKAIAIEPTGKAADRAREVILRLDGQ